MAEPWTKAIPTTQPIKASSTPEAPPTHVAYLLGKGTSRLLNVRVWQEEIHLLVNGPDMLYGSGRILTSLDVVGGAGFQAWTQLAAALTCTSYCGQNGTTAIPIEVETSRIGTCLRFSMGPMAMYQSQLVIRPKRARLTMWQALDHAFGNPRKSYSAVIVPEPATGHAEHDASIFEPDPSPAHGEHEHGHSPAER